MYLYSIIYSIIPWYGPNVTGDSILVEGSRLQPIAKPRTDQTDNIHQIDGTDHTDQTDQIDQIDGTYQIPGILDRSDRSDIPDQIDQINHLDSNLPLRDVLQDLCSTVSGHM